MQDVNEDEINETNENDVASGDNCFMEGDFIVMDEVGEDENDNDNNIKEAGEPPSSENNITDENVENKNDNSDDVHEQRSCDKVNNYPTERPTDKFQSGDSGRGNKNDLQPPINPKRKKKRGGQKQRLRRLHYERMKRMRNFNSDNMKYDSSGNMMCNEDLLKFSCKPSVGKEIGFGSDYIPLEQPSTSIDNSKTVWNLASSCVSIWCYWILLFIKI